MKKINLFTSIFIIVILAFQTTAQDYTWHSTSNPHEPQIIFTNPAGIAFQEHRQAILSSQLLYAGLANDKLSNHYLGYIEPIGGIGVFGFRGSYFNSHILKQNNFSLLYSRALINSRLSLGINLNFHHDAYDKSKFQLRGPDDPLLTKSTSVNAFGVGLGVIYNPVSDLYMGLSLDNLNQPDISLEGSRASKPLVTNFGLCYRIFNIVPEFDVKTFRTSQRSETYYIFGLRQLWLNDAANLSIQYQRDCFSFGAAYAFNKLRVDYRYSYPLNELHEISTGTHQFTLSYHFDGYGGYPIAPKINVLSPKSAEVDTSCFRLQAQVADKSGLKQIWIQLNGENFTTYDYTQKDRLATIDIPIVPLKEGENRITLIASNEAKQSSEMIKVNYTAPEVSPIIVSPPKVEILTPLEAETNASSVRLKILVEFILELKDLKVKINGKEVKLRGKHIISKEKAKIDVEAEVDLEEGMNEIEVLAFNKRGTGSRKESIRYNPITKSLYNQLWAVVIGINNYKDRNIEDLSYAVRDAKAIEKLLREHFHFDHVMALYEHNAARENILRAFSTELKAAQEEDGIFIFFSGHGCTGEGIQGGPLGYIVPVDGTFDEKEFYVRNIPMSLIREISQTIQAKHIYYVMDCCYGGLLLTRGPKQKKPSEKADYSFLKSLTKKPVRQVLTAGGKGQPVLDSGSGGHSVFTGVLIEALQGEADFNQDGFITAEELNFYVRQRVHTTAIDMVRGHPIYRGLEQTPQYGKWFGEGEFIFTAGD